MRSLFRNERFRKILGKIILGIVVFAAAAQVFYILAAGGAFRWIVKLDSPYNYPGSTWESEDPRIFLHVVDGIPEHAEAYLVMDGDKTPIEILMDDNIRDVCIYDSPVTKQLFMGSHKTSSEKVVIKPYPDHDHLFDGAYSEIILYRTDNP